jgi:hypothetical protein
VLAQARLQVARQSARGQLDQMRDAFFRFALAQQRRRLGMRIAVGPALRRIQIVVAVDARRSASELEPWLDL